MPKLHPFLCERMAKTYPVKKPEDARVNRLDEAVRHGLQRGELDPVLAALLARAVEHVRECIHARHHNSRDIELLCRPDTLLNILDACYERLERALDGTGVSIGLVGRQRKPLEDAAGPCELSHKTWEAMRERLVSTEPAVVRRHAYNLYRYNLSVRPGERLLQVPGTAFNVEDFLNSAAFVGELVKRLPPNRGSKTIVTQVQVSGRYLNDATLDHVYKEDPPKRHAAQLLDGHRESDLDHELLAGLLDGTFNLITRAGRTPQEMLALIQRLQSDPTLLVVVNSDPHRLDLSSLSIFVRGRLYGWVRTSDPVPDGQPVILACKKTLDRGGIGIERVETVLVFKKDPGVDDQS